MLKLPDPAFTDPFTKLRPQDAADKTKPEDTAPFGMGTRMSVGKLRSSSCCAVARPRWDQT